MKRILMLGVGFVAALSLLWAGFASAANVRTGDSPRLAADEVIDGSYYTSGQSVTIDGKVQGDLFCAGQTVEITGTVEGDVLCAAQTVTVSGHVGGDIRTAGQVVVVKGKIDGSATVLGQNVSLVATATIGRDLTVTAQNASVDSAVARDATIVAETFAGDATIGRNIDVFGTSVALHGKTKVEGNFSYTSASDASIASSAQIAGKTEHYTPSTTTKPMTTTGSYAGAALFGFSTLLILGVALLFVTPRLMAATAAAVRQSPLGTLVAGCIGLFLVPIVAVMLCLTVVGALLGVMLLLGWVISMMAAVVISGHVLGQFILKKVGWTDAWHHLASLVLGLLAIFVASLIPMFGMLVVLVAVIWGVGAQWYLVIKRRGQSLGMEAKKA